MSSQDTTQSSSSELIARAVLLHDSADETQASQGMESNRSGARIVKAKTPLSEMFGYVTSLRTITSGRATSTMSFDHFEEVSPSIARQVLTEVKGRVDLIK